MAEPLRIGLLGFGNIGTGLIESLEANRALLEARCGRPLAVRRIADIDIETPRPVEVDRSILTTDARSVVRDPQIDVIVELIGGIEPARGFVELALREGKHVVTANKALLAAHGPELLALARDRHVRLFFEAAVGGGIPVIRTLEDCLNGNRIERIEAILNGTCNYILTQMLEEDMSFEAALADAQRLGYAEPDPTADIESIDAANKIAVLASLAFGFDVRYEDVWRVGITQLTLQDLRSAITEGYVVKQRAVAELDAEGRLWVCVRPALLWRFHPLASVSGVLNGLMIRATPLGALFLSGPGAGRAATSSAVLSDLLAIARLRPGAPLEPPFLDVPVGRKPLLSPGPEADGYWLRILTDGNTEAVADIADALVSNRVAIERITESLWEQDHSGATHVVEVFTAQAAEEDIRRAAHILDDADWSPPESTPLVLPRVD